MAQDGHEATMDLSITIYEFHNDGQEIVRGTLSTLIDRSGVGIAHVAVSASTDAL